MKVVGNLLNRFKHLEPPDRVIKDSVVEAVKDIVGVELNKEDIKVGDKNVLFITTHSSIKSAIFEVKDVIITRINNILLKSKIKDIK